MPVKQNILLFPAGHMGINFRCADGAVSQHFLDIPDIHILFQKQGGERMPEHMRRQMLFNTGKLRVMYNHVADRLVG